MNSGTQEGERSVSKGSLSSDGLYKKDPEAAIPCFDSPGYDHSIVSSGSDHPNVSYGQEPEVVADGETLAREASEEKANSKSFKTWIPYLAILVLLVAVIILAWQFA